MAIRTRRSASRPAAKATPKRAVKRALKPGAKPVGADAPVPRAGIESLRGRIDAVDRELHALLNERARLAREVGVSKGKQGRLVDFYRPERESQVLRMALERNAAARAEGTLRDEEVVRLFREIMSACLAQEEPLKVGFLGPEGTFSQAAVYKHFGHSARALALGSIDEVFREVEAGHADFGVVPIRTRPRAASTTRSIVS
jgi:chorismate mutase / prephenate dehydratase